MADGVCQMSSTDIDYTNEIPCQTVETTHVWLSLQKHYRIYTYTHRERDGETVESQNKYILHPTLSASDTLSLDVWSIIWSLIREIDKRYATDKELEIYGLRCHNFANNETVNKANFEKNDTFIVIKSKITSVGPFLHAALGSLLMMMVGGWPSRTLRQRKFSKDSFRSTLLPENTLQICLALENGKFGELQSGWMQSA